MSRRHVRKAIAFGEVLTEITRVTPFDVEASIARWQARLGLQTWFFRVEFGKVEGGVAECEAKPEYLKADMRFDLDEIRAEYLDDYVRHELIHCLVWPLGHVADVLAAGDPKLQEWCRVSEEGLVTALERVLSEGT